MREVQSWTLIMYTCYNFNAGIHTTSRIDLITDSDTILNFFPVEFCLYYVSAYFMKEHQFSRRFDFRKLFNMSVKVYIFMKAFTMKKFSYTLWRVRILQHWTKS